MLSGNITVPDVPLDLLSMTSVKNFAKHLRKKSKYYGIDKAGLDVLVLNA